MQLYDWLAIADELRDGMKLDIMWQVTNKVAKYNLLELIYQRCIFWQFY